MRRPPSNQLIASCPLPIARFIHIRMPTAQNCKVILSAVLLLPSASCNEGRTGSFSEQPATNLVDWSNSNPDVSDQTWRKVQTLNCQVASGQVCGPRGCKGFKPVTSVRWHPSTKRYERCGGDEPCDSYAAQVSYSGAWANIAVPERSMLARLTASGQFVEVLTQMDAVYVYHGQCEPLR